MPQDEAARLIYAPNVQHNSSLNSVKFLSSCFAGAVAGILGLENWAGFAFFIASTLLTAACMYVVNCRGRPAKYVSGGVKELANPGQDNVFSFVLVWTLFYGESWPRSEFICVLTLSALSRSRHWLLVNYHVTLSHRCCTRYGFFLSYVGLRCSLMTYGAVYD